MSTTEKVSQCKEWTLLFVLHTLYWNFQAFVNIDFSTARNIMNYYALAAEHAYPIFLLLFACISMDLYIFY